MYGFHFLSCLKALKLGASRTGEKGKSVGRHYFLFKTTRTMPALSSSMRSDGSHMTSKYLGCLRVHKSI